MKDETCNGYENWETWSLALLISNDEGIYDDIKRRRFYEEEQVEKYIKELFPEGIQDYENEGKAKCYREVNWTEIFEVVEGFND